jgi:hypothetical protein
VGSAIHVLRVGHGGFAPSWTGYFYGVVEKKPFMNTQLYDDDKDPVDEQRPPLEDLRTTQAWVTTE